jgi:hypothetical protein
LQARIDPVAQVGDDFSLSQSSGSHVVLIGQHRTEDRLRDDGKREPGDYLQRGPRVRRVPTKWIGRGSLRGIESVADDIDDEPQELKAGEAEQEQDNAERQGKETIAPELPGETQQTTDQFRGGILVFLALLWRRVGHPEGHVAVECVLNPEERNDSGWKSACGEWNMECVRQSAVATALLSKTEPRANSKAASHFVCRRTPYWKSMRVRVSQD